MAVLYYAAPLVGRRADGVSALAAAALLIVGFAPSQLVAVGFIMSFTVVAGLMMLCPVLDRLAESVSLRKLPLLAERAADRAMVPGAVPSGIERLAHALWTRLRALVVLSVSAWLVSAPLSIYFFGRFTPVPLISNVVAIPLAFLSVLAGCLSILTGQALPVLADIFNHANLAVVGMLTLLTDCLSHLPGGSVHVGPVPAWPIWCWFVAMGAVVAFVQARPSRA
jgi:competence protein ComEC